MQLIIRVVFLEFLNLMRLLRLILLLKRHHVLVNKVRIFCCYGRKD